MLLFANCCGWLTNYHSKRTSTNTLALGYPLLGPSRHVSGTLLPHACRSHSPALFFSAAINSVMKRSAPCSAVLRYSPSSWAAIVHWSALIPRALRLSRKHPIQSSFSCPPPRAIPAPYKFSEHDGLWQSRVLHAPHKSRELERIMSDTI